ncbi:MAG: TetR/AcrR family transcriptional regulator [Actinomycetota bacterium]|nr:TetR/AcrR family transcriptional regulator [Actinomycetota bacterium]
MEMSEKPTKNIIQNTKKNIIDVARRLFSEYTYLGVSMSDIAKGLNITKAALYYHFIGKADIYENVLNEVFNNLKSILKEALNEATIDKRLHKLIKSYLDYGLKEKNFVRSFMLKFSPAESRIQNYIFQFRKQVDEIIQPLIKDALISKKLPKQIDYQLFASLLISMMDGLILEYSFLNKKIESDKIADQIIAVLF